MKKWISAITFIKRIPNRNTTKSEEKKTLYPLFRNFPCNPNWFDLESRPI